MSEVVNIAKPSSPGQSPKNGSTKADTKPGLNLESYRADILNRRKTVLDGIQNLQNHITQAVGQLNLTNGELRAVNRMLGRPDEET